MIGDDGGDVILLFEFVGFVVVVVKWWCLWSNGSGDSCFKGGISEYCRIAVLKCIPGEGGGGASGGGGVVVVLVGF